MARIELSHADQQVLIEDGELVGYLLDGIQRIHQKGSPGWRNADTEMFPIIGPTAEAGFGVSTPQGTATQDQHGLLRELNYSCVEQTARTARFRKTYTANTPIANSKFPAKSTAEQLSWPYDFSFEKHFELHEKGLKISFHISGDAAMPFMLGYHPAFALHTPSPTIQAGEKRITLQEVLDVGNRALHVPHCHQLSLHDSDELHLTSSGFGAFMLWTEVPNMICIEPISFYPYDVAQKDLHTGFQPLGSAPEFWLEISR